METKGSKRVFLVSTITVLIPFSVILILSFGNPQWNRWIYVWQMYHRPGGEECSIHEDEDPGTYCWTYTDNRCPAGYTGVWRIWSPDGRLVEEVTMLDGNAKGKNTVYRPDGTVRYEYNW